MLTIEEVEKDIKRIDELADRVVPRVSSGYWLGVHYYLTCIIYCLDKIKECLSDMEEEEYDFVADDLAAREKRVFG